MAPRSIGVLIQHRAFRQAEIGQLHLTPAGHENIGWLDVPVDDPVLVRNLQRCSDLHRIVQQCLQRQRTRSNPQLQGQPFEQLHGDERLAILLADVIDSTDVVVI